MARRGMKRGTKTKPGKVVDFAPPGTKMAPPDKPAWINKDEAASAEWDRVVAALSALGILAAADGFALEAYCTAYSDWRRYEIMVRELGDGVIYKPAKDPKSEYLQVHPLVSLCQKTLMLVRALAAELGLNPSARADMNKGGGGGVKRTATDPLEKLLSGNKES